MEQIDLLQQLGLNEKEAKVYLAALEFGPTTIIDLAVKSGVKRTTIHEFIEPMIQQGFIIATFSGKRKLYQAAPPESLKQILEKQTQAIKKLLPDLKFLASKAPQAPKIRYYEGVEGIKQIYEDFLTAKEPIDYFGSVKDEISVLGKQYISDWVKRRLQKGIRVNAIRIKSREIPIKEWQGGETYLRDLRFFPLDIKENFTNLMIYDNKVAITSSAKESYGMIIESQELAISLKYIWRVVWSISKTK
jgi:sugar-specific transcriptional regulator TrmB